MVYFQNSLADFSLIGNIQTTYRFKGTFIIDFLQISEEIVFSAVFAYPGRSFVYKISTVTQKVIDLFEYMDPVFSLFGVMLVADGYLNILKNA